MKDCLLSTEVIKTNQKINKEQIKSFEMNSSEDSTALIWRLNDDCLLHIISFLDQIERLKLSFVCQRFYTVVERSIKASKLEFDIQTMDRNFNLIQIQQILKGFGAHFRTLNVCGNFKAYIHLESIALKCRNLEEVHFNDVLFDFEMYKQFFTSSKQLQTLVLTNCSIDNEACKIISLLPSLSHLNLSYNRYISGEFLRNLKTVTELNLSNCFEIDPLHFIEICKSLQLKKLNIVRCYRLNEKAFLTLAETQTTLEEILMSNSYSGGDSYLANLAGQIGSLKHVSIHSFKMDPIEGTNILSEITNNRKDSLESLEIYNMFVEDSIHDQILGLPNLRKLSLVGDSNLDDSYLGEISKNCKLLERVNIAKSEEVSEIGILNLVQNLKHLKYLNISNCWQFDDNLIHQVYHILEEAADSERKSPLSLCVYDTGVLQQSFLNMQEGKLLLSLRNEIASDMDAARYNIEFDDYDMYCDYYRDNFDSDYSS